MTASRPSPPRLVAARRRAAGRPPRPRWSLRLAGSGRRAAGACRGRARRRCSCGRYRPSTNTSGSRPRADCRVDRFGLGCASPGSRRGRLGGASAVLLVVGSRSARPRRDRPIRARPSAAASSDVSSAAGEPSSRLLHRVGPSRPRRSELPSAVPVCGFRTGSLLSSSTITGVLPARATPRVARRNLVRYRSVLLRMGRELTRSAAGPWLMLRRALIARSLLSMRVAARPLMHRGPLSHQASGRARRALSDGVPRLRPGSASGSPAISDQCPCQNRSESQGSRCLTEQTVVQRIVRSEP